MARSRTGLLAAIALAGASCAVRGGPVPQTVPVAPTADSAAVAATALGLLGRPYTFGGATPAGFDSSGFTHYVYAQHDIELPRLAAQQYRVGTPAARHDLRPGDLVFFDTASRSNPSHVGLVVGDGRFLYASVALGEVHADRLDTSYWRQRYLGARRIVASRDGRVARHIDRSSAWRRGKTGASLRRLR